MFKSSWMMDSNSSREMPSCSVIDLAEIRRSSKISLWIWSIISWVVTVLGRPGRGASQLEKSPRLNWATLFLTASFDSVCSPNVSFRMVWISYWPFHAEKKTWWQLGSRCCWNRTRHLTYFLSISVTRKDNSAHEQTPLSKDTIDSVLRHREVGRAKDLSAPLVLKWTPLMHADTTKSWMDMHILLQNSGHANDIVLTRPNGEDAERDSQYCGNVCQREAKGARWIVEFMLMLVGVSENFPEKCTLLHRASF